MPLDWEQNSIAFSPQSYSLCNDVLNNTLIIKNLNFRTNEK